MNWIENVSCDIRVDGYDNIQVMNVKMNLFHWKTHNDATLQGLVCLSQDTKQNKWNALAFYFIFMS